MTHTDIVIDSDAFFEIDPITRSIKNMTPSKISVMQNDHNSERFTFSIPRYVEGHDMLTSDKVEVHYINIDSGKQNQTTGIYEMPDLEFESGDTEKVTCSWLLSHNATKYAGKLTFLVRFVCFVGDTTEIDYAWNTAVFDGISVGAGLDVADEALDEYADIIEAWKKELEEQIHVWIDDSVASQADLTQIQTNKENIETLTADQTELKTRVDNLLAAETEDGELIDVRVGYDGKIYETAGESVREQFKDLNKKHTEDIARITTSEIDIDELQGAMIVPTAEGESIHLTDSAKAKFRGLKLFGKTNQVKTTGKNLLDSRVMDLSNWTTPSLSGTSPNLSYDFYLSLPIGQYTFDVTRIDDSTNVGYVQLRKKVNGVWEMYKNFTTNSVVSNESVRTFDIEEGYEYKLWYYESKGSNYFYNLTNFQIRKSTDDSTYEPYTRGKPSPSPDFAQEMNNICADGSAEVGVFGKNLIPYPYFDKTLTQNGITFTDNGDGTITVNGTATDTANFMCVNMGSPVPIKAGTYFVSGCPANGGANTFEFAFGWRENVGDTRQLQYEQGSGIEYTFEKDGYIDFICVARKGVTATNAVFKPMLKVAANTDRTWEAYKEPQTIQVNTENGLPGIPVTTGGNYTDANGQQWVCDEIDLARGVYVQRCFKQVVQLELQENLNRYSASLTHKADVKCALDNGIPLLCDILSFHELAGSGTPTVNGIRIATTSPTKIVAYYNGKVLESATVIYPLSEPIETPLTDEEIEACKALHTNRLTTTIFNDENAWMSADYVADAKTYIDNKFLELEKTILNTTT